MKTDLNPDEQTPPSAVPLILVRPFKSLLRTPIYIKHRRHRRSDYFISMNDHRACIPPGTPISLVSQRTAATSESTDTRSPVQNATEDSESVVSRLDKATESVSDAGACGTSVSWSLLSLPTMQKTNHLVQFTPSQDVSTDDDILHDILLGGVGMTTTSDQVVRSDNGSKNRGKVEYHSQRLVMRPLLMVDGILHQNASVEHDISSEVYISPTHSKDREHDCCTDFHDTNNVEQSDISPDCLLSQHDDECHIPEVPIIKSLLYPTMSLQRLNLEESHEPTIYDSNIPKEIFCYQEEFEEDVTETMVDLDLLQESMNAGKSLSSPCLLPCPKDQPFRRRQRRFSDSKGSGPDTGSTEMSFFDIICRHQHLSVPQPDEGHSIPIVIIEVDRRKQNELPPKDTRQRRRSRASRDYQRRWQRRKDGGLYRGGVDHTPDYASV